MSRWFQRTFFHFLDRRLYWIFCSAILEILLCYRLGSANSSWTGQHKQIGPHLFCRIQGWKSIIEFQGIRLHALSCPCSSDQIFSISGAHDQWRLSCGRRKKHCEFSHQSLWEAFRQQARSINSSKLPFTVWLMLRSAFWKLHPPCSFNWWLRRWWDISEYLPLIIYSLRWTWWRTSMLWHFQTSFLYYLLIILIANRFTNFWRN